MFVSGAILTLAVMAAAAEGRAMTRFVRNPNQVPGIQACLLLSRPGDVVEVDWNQNPYFGNFVVPAGVYLKGIPAMQGRPMLRPADPAKPVVELRTNAAAALPARIFQFDIREGDNSGVYISGNGAAIVRNNEIAENQADKGAGICSSCSGRVDLIFNYIRDNVAADFGGGLFLTGGGTVAGKGNEIMRNSAARGGGMEIRGPLTATFQERIFMDNSAGNGGGVAVVDNPRLTTISSDELINNDATAGYGGTIYALRSSLRVENSYIGETACPLDGGALYGMDSTVVLDGCVITGATARSGAGAFLSGRLNAASLIEGNEFRSNRAVYRGGAIHLARMGRMNIRNNFFDRNLAPQGSGVFVASDAAASVHSNSFAHTFNAAVIGTVSTEAVRLQGAGNLTSFANNIVTYHRVGVTGDGGVLAWAGSNDFWRVGVCWRGVRNAGGNNLNLNPLFTVFNANGVGANDLHLQAGSPAQGTADPRQVPPDDFDGDPRDSLPDRGADEIVP